ncbi:hypothetical protein H4S07_005088, partial [Coemansia furcata]
LNGKLAEYTSTITELRRKDAKHVRTISKHERKVAKLRNTVAKHKHTINEQWAIIATPATATPAITTPATATPAITMPVVPMPDFAYQLGLCLPPFCRKVNVHSETLNAIYDQSGAEVTPEHLLAVVKPFTFINLDLLMTIYHSMYGCQLISGRFNSHQFVQKLAKLDGFKQ